MERVPLAICEIRGGQIQNGDLCTDELEGPVEVKAGWPGNSLKDLQFESVQGSQEER